MPRYIVFSVLIALIFFLFPVHAPAQVNKWMNVGSIHNWFSAIGCEIEVGRTSDSPQQDGLQWPAIYRYQDNQAAKGFWIGVQNFTDNTGFYPVRVVHVGPRVSGIGEFIPLQFELVSKFDPPTVIVDGSPTFEKSVTIDRVDETIPCDRIFLNTVNTILGITMERKILAWGTPPHDNYMIYEFIFTNTGNTDADPDPELNQTLEGVYFFWQYRYSMTRQTRYVVGNASGWGINTMHDARGDGPTNPSLYNDPPSENFRASFGWHGYYPQKVVAYDNIGAPIWQQDQVTPHYVTEKDTVGRLGAPQFVGVVTLHADASASDETDDPSQPSTTSTYGSDEPPTSNNDAFNQAMMNTEYEWITRGHSQRHAWLVEPTGNFAAQTAGPNIEPGGPGGFSIGEGYGPYTLAPGEDVRIVIAEAAAGLSRERCIEIGRQYKNGQITAAAKNQAVMTGKDSLFKTFRLAIDNYQSGYTIIEDAPLPVKNFYVTGLGDRISLSWETYDANPDLSGFRIYRQTGDYVDPLQFPELIYEAGPAERTYDDVDAVRGVAYHYYILSVGPDGSTSSRYYTQAYAPTFLKRPEGTNLSDIRVVPNPFIISEDERVRFPGTSPFEKRKLAFFNIPGQCTIQIFTEIGELIQTIDHADGTGDEFWDLTTSSRQVVVSGIYIAVITDKRNGDREIVKFAIIR